MNRHDSDKAAKATRDEFTHGNVSRNISAANANLGSIYSELYVRTIDYGAHPNERGSSLSSKTVTRRTAGSSF